MDSTNNIGGACCGGHHHAVKAIMGILLAIVLVILAVYLAGLARNAFRNYDYIGKSPDMVNQITVTGTAKITAVPDVAVLSLGIVSEGTSVNLAQKGATDKMNSIIDALKKQFKIEAKDIKTENFSVNPKYDYNNGRQNIIGYSVNQNISVKVRNFDSTGDILAKATELGANSVNGPSFIIDDMEKAKADAREKAIAQAKLKAKTLSDQAGIKLGRIVSFYEGGLDTPNVAYGMGGDMAFGVAEMKSATPTIEPGSQDVQLTVSIGYEIR